MVRAKVFQWGDIVEAVAIDVHYGNIWNLIVIYCNNLNKGIIDTEIMIVARISVLHIGWCDYSNLGLTPAKLGERICETGGQSVRYTRTHAPRIYIIIGHICRFCTDTNTCTLGKEC